MDNNTNLPRTWQDFLSGQKFFPAVVKSIERIHDRTWEMQPNCHNHFEMVYVKKGSIIYNVNGTDVPLGQYELILIKPGQTHVVSVQSQEICELFVLSFSFETAETDENKHLTDFMDFINTEEEHSYIKLRLTRKNDFTNVFDRIVRERRKSNMWNDLMVNLLMMEFFVLLSRGIREEWEQNIKKRSLKMKELLKTAKEYIDINYNKSISLSDVASYVFFSESYFAHSFKQEFGISPKSYLLQTRINASKDYLENTDMKIGDIALSVGFSGQQRFNDIFKKTEGITPLKYRKNIRMENLNIEK
jgi:AraC-like DNA-binding protein